jgi:hypothetical protein
MGIRLPFPAALGTHLNGNKPVRPVLAQEGPTIGEGMRRRVLQSYRVVLRHFAIAGLALFLGLSLGVFLGIGGAFAQSGNPAPPDQQGKSTPDAKSAEAIKDNERKAAEFVEAQQAINGPGGNPECVWLGRRVVRLMWLDDLDTAFRHLDLYDRFGCPGGHVQAAAAPAAAPPPPTTAGNAAPAPAAAPSPAPAAPAK